MILAKVDLSHDSILEVLRCYNSSTTKKSHKSETTWSPECRQPPYLLCCLWPLWGVGRGQQLLHSTGGFSSGWSDSCLFSSQGFIPSHSHLPGAQVWRCKHCMAAALYQGSLKCWCENCHPSPTALKCPLTLPSHPKKGESSRAVCHCSLRRAKPVLVLCFACFLRAVALSQQSWNAFLHSWEPDTFASLFAQENLMGFNFIPSWQHFSREAFWYLLAAIELKPRISGV